MPEEWWISMVAEAFHCTPSVAMREIEHTPPMLLSTILALRHYAGLKQEYEAACDRNDQKTAGSPRFQDIRVMEFEIVAELRAQPDGGDDA